MRFLLFLMMLPAMAEAESLVATRTIRALSVLSELDMTLVAADIPGALTDISAATGLEARVTLYAGRPIRSADLGPPATIDRNQIVPLAYATGTILILTEGRALARGGVGDVIRVMNIASRTTVTGRIGADGMVRVGPNP
ncbi:MAG: flagellar basal body P-ring formation chaperone FlgA [Paracoccaceae bacterium]